MKFLIPSVFLLILVGLVIGVTVLSGETEQVAATVRAESFSVAVEDGVIAYGTLALSSTQDTTAGGVNDEQYAGNDGNATEKLNIIGFDSDEGGAMEWQLLATRGANQYFHEFATDGGTNWTALATQSYTTLCPSVAQTVTIDFHLRIGLPVSSGTYATQDVNVTVQATSP